jgi:hypothetical protein
MASLEQGEKPFSMLQDLWIRYRDWVFETHLVIPAQAGIQILDKTLLDARSAGDALTLPEHL